MQKNIKPSAASTTTTTGTATAACIPGDDMVLASARKSFDELLAALDAVAAVEDPALLEADASAVDAADVDEADIDCCDLTALEATAGFVGVELAADDVIVSSVVDCD